jgi:RNase adaptor protein for sRNA GlmZ degradation
MLNIYIYSFSYHLTDKIFLDNLSHGGGFIFDCRCIPNPGRIEEFRNLDGRDLPVKEWLDDNELSKKFRGNILQIVELATKEYINNSYTEMSVGFGCTGGKHRSVYFSEALAKDLTKFENIAINLNHIQRDGKSCSI